MLKQSLFSLLTVLATLSLLGLADVNIAQPQPGKAEALNLIADLVTGDIVLPPTTSYSAAGYKIWTYTFDIQRVNIFNIPDSISILNFCHFSNGITNYSLLIIFPFHSFW
ncbi:hypothetical protein LVD17_24555 [Fulvivirga ulvae]|uniref:hypothetical protein n=1 Tax=Fulvivirga ulvae TaxID=2904245 RepID=UPI001F275BB4|nr:hypothetical protein [Fulvivirga ulvae]UII31468.1 hypothetical protein LVD17_24555 [Fulvivirga ulvae]